MNTQHTFAHIADDYPADTFRRRAPYTTQRGTERVLAHTSEPRPAITAFDALVNANNGQRPSRITSLPLNDCTMMAQAVGKRTNLSTKDFKQCQKVHRPIRSCIAPAIRNCAEMRSRPPRRVR